MKQYSPVYKVSAHSNTSFAKRLGLDILVLCTALTATTILTAPAHGAPVRDTNAKILELQEDTITHHLHLTFASSSKILMNGKEIDKNTLIDFYNKRSFSPVWVTKSGLTTKGKAIISAINAADQNGLNPKDYNLAYIDTLINNKSTESRAKLDILISSLVLQYVHDLALGKTEPKRVNQLGAEGTETLENEDIATLLDYLASSGEVKDIMPKHAEYSRLKELLRHYRYIEQSGGWPIVSFGIEEGKSLLFGSHSPAIKELKNTLTVMGDLPLNNGTDEFDESLMSAVRKFQSRHGLTTDGIIGKSTIDALQVPASERINQIMANMERLRWLPENLGDEHIVVNIPAYQLKAMRKGEDALEMKVIVGKNYRPTPIFSNKVTNVVFNPTWGVPNKIAAHDLFPKIKQDPGFLARNGFSLMRKGEDGVSTTSADEVDWEEVENGKDFANNFSLRQRPGSDNALGKVKFLMPNSSSIYLHDTSHPDLFEKERRSLSSGCIRVEEPELLSRFILNGQGNWDNERINTTYNSNAGKPTYIAVENPMPVHLVYWTAWVDENGTPHFYNDIYNKDSDLILALGIKEDIKLAKR